MNVLSRHKQSIVDITAEKFGRLDDLVSVLKDNNVSVNTKLAPNTEIIINNENKGVKDVKDFVNNNGISFNNDFVEVAALPTVTFTVKDPHSKAQESVKVYRNDVLLGSTDELGQIAFTVNGGDSLEFYKNGFFAKVHVATLDAEQAVAITYVAGNTTDIGGNLWSDNLILDDLQGSVDSPDNNGSNVAAYGNLYRNSKIPKTIALYPNFTHPLLVDINALLTFIGSDGNKLKSIGDSFWNATNSGTDDYGFDLRGAGFYSLSTQEFRNEAWLSYDLNTNKHIRLNNLTGAIVVDESIGGLASASLRLIKSTGDAFNFSISVNNAGAAVVGATITVEGTPYVTDINGQVHIEEHKTSINYTIVKTGFTTANGTMDLTTQFTKIVTLVAL